MTCSVVQWFSKASIQKAQNGLSSQIIKTTSCLEKPNTMIQLEEPSNFSSYQTLTEIGEVINLQ
jgi:hypothetical protein